jgi:hypothetical protein
MLPSVCFVALVIHITECSLASFSLLPAPTLSYLPPHLCLALLVNLPCTTHTPIYHHLLYNRLLYIYIYIYISGYWVEIVKRNKDLGCEYNFSQTMLRIKDPAKSIAFYKALNMQVVREAHFDSFSLYFLASPTGDVEDTKERFDPVLELTHNHGTESQDDFKHYNGNEEGRQGFGHVGFLVDE